MKKRLQEAIEAEDGDEAARVGALYARMKADIRKREKEMIKY